MNKNTSFHIQFLDSSSQSQFNFKQGRRVPSGNNRTRQVLLTNQNVLNSLINNSSNNVVVSTTRSSDSKNLESHRSSNSNISKSVLIRKPFKHFNSDFAKSTIDDLIQLQRPRTPAEEKHLLFLHYQQQQQLKNENTDAKNKNNDVNPNVCILEKKVISTSGNLSLKFY
jgi:hypothetical protein